MTHSKDFPPSYDPTYYQHNNPDLAQMGSVELLAHYENHGIREGRVANALKDRRDFARLIQPDQSALEIGPFASPLLSGQNVSFCDVLSCEELKERARSLNIDPEQVPYIRYKLGPRFLDDIPEKFDAILSSHNIEHQPDIVNHLCQVERRLNPQGRYFVIIPDKRYCFDRDIAESTIADILQAHEEKRTVHALKSIIEHRALTVHNDASRHWQEVSITRMPVDPNKVTSAIEE